MKDLLLVSLNIFAVIFGCNLSAAPDYRLQGWRETSPNYYARDYEKVSINTFGAFYDESRNTLEKGFCIGTTFEKPATVALESAVIETGDGKSYAAQWSNNVTLDGNRAYARKECGHLELRWTFDLPQKEIFRGGAQIIFNLRVGGQPETVRAEIVPTKDHKAE